MRSIQSITYNGGNPREVQEFVRERLGPGHLYYTWGGTGWSVLLGHTRVEYGDTLTWDGERIRLEKA